jgi:hypothetical protein
MSRKSIYVVFFICGIIHADVPMEEGVNQIQNWDFERGILGLFIEQANGAEPSVRRCLLPDAWQIVYIPPESKGAIELDDRQVHNGSFSLKVTTQSIDGVVWHFKVMQDRMSFEAGKKHTIKFWAKADAPRTIQVCLQMSYEPWPGYLWETVTLTTHWQQFTVQVIPPQDSDKEHFLAFHSGQSLVTWWLDDVRYYQGGPRDEKASTPSVGSEGLSEQMAGSLEPAALHVEGSMITTEDGNAVRLQGINVPSLEWLNTGDTQTLESLRVAIHDWNANVIRLPLSQDRWFGKAEGQNDDGRLYQMIVDEFVRYISGYGAYVVLELHWSNAGVWGENIGQHYMPDMNSVEFWNSVCALYANNPAVLFDLYNEPRGVSWDIWKSGGWVTEHEGLSYESPGMQGLLEAVRSTGAENVVIAGGLEWGYDLRGIPAYALDDPLGNPRGIPAYALDDPFGNIVYSTHIYPWKGNEEDWDSRVGHVIGKYPFLVGEVGCLPDEGYDPYTWAVQVLSYIDEYRLNWIAWCFHPYADPCLIKDWTYEPTPYWGDFVKRALEPEPDAPDPLAEALDTTLSFTTGGDENWSSQTVIYYHDGDAARSGTIEINQESWLQTRVQGAGTVSFFWKVSSEANYDELEFYIDGECQDHISDLEDWHKMTYEITGSALHTLKWRYTKDGSVDRGDDCGWVDKVEWVPDS